MAKKQATSSRRWSRHVTETSHALALEDGVFRAHDPKAVARSLKRSAEASKERKADPYRSALSMLTFYINRAGTKLPATQKRVLEQAKAELRVLFEKGEPEPAKEEAQRRDVASRYSKR